MEEAACFFISQLSVQVFTTVCPRDPPRHCPSRTLRPGETETGPGPADQSQSSFLTGTGLSSWQSGGAHLTGWTMLPFPRPVCPHLGQAPNP